MNTLFFLIVFKSQLHLITFLIYKNISHSSLCFFYSEGEHYFCFCFPVRCIAVLFCYCLVSSKCFLFGAWVKRYEVDMINEYVLDRVIKNITIFSLDLLAADQRTASHYKTLRVYNIEVNNWDQLCRQEYQGTINDISHIAIIKICVTIILLG